MAVVITCDHCDGAAEARMAIRDVPLEYIIVSVDDLRSPARSPLLERVRLGKA